MSDIILSSFESLKFPLIGKTVGNEDDACYMGEETEAERRFPKVSEK